MLTDLIDAYFKDGAEGVIAAAPPEVQALARDNAAQLVHRDLGVTVTTAHYDEVVALYVFAETEANR